MKETKLYKNFINKDFGEILYNEPMRKHTSFKIGGPAEILIIPETEKQIVEAIKFCREKDIKHFIMGNGSNLLVRDSGIKGVVIKISNRFGKIKIDEDKLVCESGALLSVVGKKLLRSSLSGFEFASGIPGTIGGAIAMNAGAYGGEMKDIVTKVRALDEENNIITIAKEDMDFRYRGSKVVDEKLIVLSAEFQLEKGEYSAIEGKMKELTYKRTSKQPLDLPSGGSTFKRPEGYYAGKLIEDSGLKGLRYGDAKVSDKHSGFVVNKGNASFKEVSTLIYTVQKIVRDKFNVELEREIKIIGD